MELSRRMRAVALVALLAAPMASGFGLSPPVLAGVRGRAVSEAARRVIMHLRPDGSDARTAGQAGRAEGQDGFSGSVSRRGMLGLLGAGILAGAAGESNAEGIPQDGLIKALDSSMRGSISALDTYLGKGTGGPKARDTDRPALAQDFASALAQAIQGAAVEDEKLIKANELTKLEQEYALKCVSFFPGAMAALKETGWNGEQEPINFENMWGSEVLANLAVYSRLHVISERTPSPLSRLKFTHSVSSRVLSDTLDSTGFNFETYRVEDPQSDLKWMEGVEAMLAAYKSVGYGVGTVGEKSYGKLDEVAWKEDGTGSLSVFFSNISLMDAAQVLAGEAQNDLAAAILPTSPLLTFLHACAIDADAEDYYMGNTYQSNPANYRPDGVVIQVNLQARKPPVLARAL